MRTALVILNWNTRELLRRFLPPLLESIGDSDAGVIVADNASTDGSLEVLRQEFPGVEVIPLDRNYGFTGGYDRALKELSGRAEYYILMNSDIEVTPGWLEPLVEWMDTHPRCGACSPKILSWKDPGRFEYAGAAGGFVDLLGIPYCRGRVLSHIERDEGQYDTPCRVMWASGACLMVRSSVWEQMGGLDPRFFAHMEEIDLCWRMQLAGHEVWSVPSSKVLHIGGGTLEAGSPLKVELNFRNGLLMLENCLPGTVGAFRARLVIALRLVLDMLVRAGYLVTGKSAAARAVKDAHKGFRALRRGIHAPGSPGADVAGYGGIVLFKYICRKFSHS